MFGSSYRRTAADAQRPEVLGDGRLGQVFPEPGEPVGVEGDDADVRPVPLVAAPGVGQVAEPDGRRVASDRHRVVPAHSSAVRTVTRSSIIARGTSVGQYPNAGRGDGRPVAYPAIPDGPDVTSGANSRQNRSTAARFGSRTRHPQDHLERRPFRPQHAGHDVPRPQAFDQRFRQREPRPLDPLQDEPTRRACLRLGPPADHGEHAARRPAVAIDGRDLERLRRRSPLGAGHGHAVGAVLAQVGRSSGQRPRRASDTARGRRSRRRVARRPCRRSRARRSLRAW